MRILILAPHPYFQERGTPIAVNLLAQALCERGEKVDILTYHEGTDPVNAAGTLHRIRPPLFGLVRGIRPGPSFKKLVCDLYFLACLVGLLRRHRYDVIHAVEESSFMAMLLGPIFRTPFIFDVDSSMTTQIVDRYPVLKPTRRALEFLESLPARKAIAVVPVCEALASRIARYPVRHLAILKDVSLLSEKPAPDHPENLRATLGIDGPIAMYIGNLEPYQGIDLLLEAFARVGARAPDACVVIIGGEDADIGKARQRAHELGIGAKVHLVGKRPIGQIGTFMSQADVLVSPRLQGENTPMKVYSYLHSGVAVLATDLPTHTQVMDGHIACLAPPEPVAFGEALAGLLQDGSRRERLGNRGRAFIETEHSYEAFRKTVNGLYDHVAAQLTPPPGAARQSPKRDATKSGGAARTRKEARRNVG